MRYTIIEVPQEAKPMTKGGSLPREGKKAFSELFLGVLGAKPSNSTPKLTSDLRLRTSDLCSTLPAPRSMLFNSLYFRLKPFVPQSIRLEIRRWFVLRKRERVGNIWPIIPGSDRPPEGWPGWPEGKQFALILTHDVESQRGLDRVKELAELEMELGFRSSFNFVPEGAYTVPPALRTWLTDRRFEVGVHDLHHDGRLYASREAFRRKAQRINRYLKEWNAVGFRSAFMLRKLDWLHELDIEYDASTFDTDPFEPQPDGQHTIFPFWVARGSEVGGQRSEVGGRRSDAGSINSRPSTLNQPRSGYVELPYTLAQDSTLFLVLKEPTIRLWKKKLDWIADRGGVALLNVHPDFVAFGDRSHSLTSYPAKLYAEFLSWVKQKYGGEYWHARPASLGKFVRPLELPKTNLGQVSRSGSNGAPCMLGSWRAE